MQWLPFFVDQNQHRWFEPGSLKTRCRSPENIQTTNEGPNLGQRLRNFSSTDCRLVYLRGDGNSPQWLDVCYPKTTWYSQFLPPRTKKVGKSNQNFSPMTPQCYPHQHHGHIRPIPFDQEYIWPQFDILSMRHLPFLVGQNERRSFVQGNQKIAPSTSTKHTSSH